MQILKNSLKGKLQSLRYFYSYLRGKVFVAIGLNILLGLLDGLGLSMFLPLLQLAEKAGSPQTKGKLSYIISLFDKLGISLTLPIALLFIASLFILKGLIFYVKGVFQVRLLQNFIKNIRVESLQNLGNLRYEYFIQSDVGRLQNSLTGEVDKVSRACQSYFQSIQHLILVLVYVAFAFMLDWRFALLVCVGGILLDFIYRGIYKNTKGVSRKIAVDSSLFQNLIFQALSNYKYLKATGEIRQYQKKLTEQVELIEKNNSRIGILSVILNSSREPLSIVVVCLAIFLQTTLFQSTLSAVLISLLFFYRALASLMQFQSTWNNYLAVSGSLENIQELNDELKLNRQKTGDKQINSFTDKIQLHNIHFSFAEKRVLQDVSLEIHKNETLALVGESGSGKSTLINLICGLLPAGEGKITIDGIDLAEVDLKSYQARIGFISQENVIFNDTIFNNVTLWAEPTDANKSKFIEACRKASISNFIEAAADGAETKLGTNGINLSGGQRQRISIARELFKDIDILILDEATSALDAETENEIQKSIEDLQGHLTMIIIAHRLSTIKPADRVAFLKSGRLEQIDTFPGLYSKNKDFKNLVDLQEVTIAGRNA